MNARGPRRKGSRIEREIVAAHLERGIPAERVPLSGSAGGSYTGDVVIAGRLRGEVKARASGAGFATIERWLGENDVLFLRRDRAEPLVLVPSMVWYALLDRAGFAQPAAGSQGTFTTPNSAMNVAPVSAKQQRFAAPSSST